MFSSKKGKLEASETNYGEICLAINIMKMRCFLFLFLVKFISLVASDGVEDKISGLPGTTFNVVFDQYSGYLNAGNNGTWKYFYW